MRAGQGFRAPRKSQGEKRNGFWAVVPGENAPRSPAQGIGNARPGRVPWAFPGRGLVEFLIATRLQAAKELLAQQDLISVKEVAYQTGFSSAIYFCRLFRRQEHQTPLAYAAQVRKPGRKT